MNQPLKAPSRQHHAIGGPLPVLLDFHNGGRGWRMSLGALVQATLLGLVLVLPLLMTDSIRSAAPEVHGPPIRLGSPVGRPDGPRPSGGEPVKTQFDPGNVYIRTSDDHFNRIPVAVSSAGPNIGEGPWTGPPGSGRPDGTPGGVSPDDGVPPGLKPPTDQQPKQPIRISTLRPPRVLRRVNPTYPPVALKARIEGEVVLDALLGEDGRVQHITVKSGHPQLVPAAKEAVAQWVYEPTLLNGEPYPALLEITVRFSLSR